MEGEEECEEEEILIQPNLENKEVANAEVAQEITENYGPQYEGSG